MSTPLQITAAEAAGALRAAADMFEQIGRTGASRALNGHALRLMQAIKADQAPAPAPEPIPQPEVRDSDFGEFMAAAEAQR